MFYNHDKWGYTDLIELNGFYYYCLFIVHRKRFKEHQHTTENDTG